MLVVIHVQAAKVLQPGQPIRTDVYLLALVPAMIGLLCLGISKLFNRWRPGVAIADEGLVVETRDDLLYIRWEDIAEVKIPLVQRDGWWIYELTNGTKVNFHGDLQDHETFATHHYQIGTAALVANRLRRIDAGETVSIGDFVLSW